MATSWSTTNMRRSPRKILAAVKRVDPDPVKFVVNTHWHGDHSGGNENLGKAGAVIVAHDNVRRRMSSEQFSSRFGKTPASPKVALPVVTFGQGVTLNLNGDAMQIVHVRAAHTDGDSLVYWKTAKVLHMGDTFFHKVTLPFIDLDSGGTIDGVIAAVRTGLAIAAPDAKIIPGHGPVATRADLAGLSGDAGRGSRRGGGGQGVGADAGAGEGRQSRQALRSAQGLHHGRRLRRSGLQQPPKRRR